VGTGLAVMTKAERRVLKFLKAVKTDDGWICRSGIMCRQSTLNSLADKGMVERHTVAGLSEYRAI